MGIDLEKIWKLCLREIKEQIPSSSLKAWIKPARLSSIKDKQATLQVRNEFSRNLILQNYQSTLLSTLQKITQKPDLEIVIEINSELPTEDYVPTFSSLKQENNTPLPEAKFSQDNRHDGLNPKFVFENFVVGSHNQFCHAAALAIAENPAAGPYNPFFIYGGVGLGKTHIMQSVGNYIKARNADAGILYISAERFLNDLIDCMRKNKMNEFRSLYRRVNLLLIDDIQFIEGKESTQQEFFHTFNSLKEKGNQIILTSDRPPKNILKLEPRLCSRFEGGLLADVQAPTYETRLAILNRKAEELKIKLNSQIADQISLAFPDNIRSLEGALAKIHAYTNFTNKTISSELVSEVLQLNNRSNPIQSSENLQSAGEQNNRILQAVAKEFEEPVAEIISPSKNKQTVLARQVCVYLARDFAQMSWSKISRILGGRGNSSLISLHKNICSEINGDPNLKKRIDQLKAKLGF